MFVYLSFIWHMFTKASSIIAGIDSGYTGTEGIVSDVLGFDGRISSSIIPKR